MLIDFSASEADEGKEDVISSTEFLAILVDVIRTFLNFLQADKENPCQMLKAFIKRKSSSANSTLLHVLRRANKKVSTPSVTLMSAFFLMRDDIICRRR